MSMYKVCLFDKDDTLVRTEVINADATHAAIQKILGYEIDYARVREAIYGRSNIEAMKHLEKLDSRLLQMQDELNALIGEYFSNAKDQLHRKNEYIIHSSLQLLKIIANHKIPIGIVSGSCYEDIESDLMLLGIEQHVSRIVGAEDCIVGGSKPHPFPYLYALDQMGFKPEECLVFEDSLPGIMSAKAAGTSVIALVNDVHSSYAETLRDAGADEVVDNFQQAKRVAHWLLGFVT